jgi:glyoxylase-like metal-dependent hydrolase (beta-lactamase superfamily II)
MTHSTRLPDGMMVFERGWLSSNSALFAVGERTALVDTGYVAHAAQTVALVREVLGARPMDLVINTHLHSDHCGGNAALQHSYPELTTLIPPGLAQAVSAWDETALTYAPTGQRCERFAFDDVLRPGTEIVLGVSPWQVHAAPGHDPHSVILFEPVSRTLISADALWENGFGVVFPELDGEEGFQEVADTLDVIERLAPMVVVPGHGGVFAGRERVEGALATARRRLANLARDPARHAAHGVKVLIKFRLLDWQVVAIEEFFSWARDTPYVQRVRQRFFADQSLHSWLQELLDQLERSGALERANDRLFNI